MKIALIQQRNTADRADNMQRLEGSIRSCAAQGAQLIVLQELHNGLYFCQTEDPAAFDLAEPVPGPSTERYGRLARELGVVIVLSLFERRAAGLYHNTAVVLEKDGTIAGLYRKMHIPDDPAYYEKILLHARRPRLHARAHLRGLLGRARVLGPMVSRSRPPHGHGGSRPAHLPHRHRLGKAPTRTMKRRANAMPGSPCSAAMRWPTACTWWPATAWGTSPTLRARRAVSSSGAAASWQALRANCSPPPPADEECNLVTDIDLQRTETVRRMWPFFRDRRTDAFTDLGKRWRE